MTDRDTLKRALTLNAAELARLREEKALLVDALKGMLEVHGVSHRYCETHPAVPVSWADLSDLARAALAKVGADHD